MRKKTGAKIQLHDYEVFLENPYRLDCTNDHLNQIIQMHGFIKLHKRRKEELLEALSTIDLIHPPRSTLNEGSSPYDSSLTIDEVNKDLEALEWQECPVQSLQTLGPSIPTIDGAGNDVSPAFKITAKKPRTKRRKTRRISDLSRGFA
ncbi:hypothetical protein CK203_018881 [Vitis vinifera]|uniref:DUF7787 domain-containing protein n=1 Tax=Vitis vinifera TaxID=29760 RepID=A0A438IQQ6_VITVI|nr:hypothetical protein CK203_018881 [Vitis vinifera]